MADQPVKRDYYGDTQQGVGYGLKPEAISQALENEMEQGKLTPRAAGGAQLHHE